MSNKEKFLSGKVFTLNEEPEIFYMYLQKKDSKEPGHIESADEKTGPYGFEAYVDYIYADEISFSTFVLSKQVFESVLFEEMYFIP